MGSPNAIAAADRRARTTGARRAASAAARSLGMLEAEAGRAAARRARWPRNEVPRAIAGGALLAMGAKAAPGLRSLLDAHEPAVRATALELLGLTGDASDADRLDAALEQSHAIAASRRAYAEVRAAAARALGRIGTRRVAASLRGALGDPAPFVRTAAAHALGRIGDRDAFDALVRQAAVGRLRPGAGRGAGARGDRPDPRDPRLGGAGASGASAHLR